MKNLCFILPLSLISTTLGLSQNVDPDFKPILKDPLNPSPPRVHCAVIQSDGKIVIGGYFGVVGDTDIVNLARLNNGGSLDETFSNNYLKIGYNTPVFSLAIQSDGKMLIGGSINATNDNPLFRLNADGTLDPNFLPNIDRINISAPRIWDIKVQ